MKVVLTKDVRDMGKKGTVIEVSDGHAINFLIPRQMAVTATATNLKQAELVQKSAQDRKVMDAELMKQNLASLAEKHLTLTMKANEQGHLYEAVSAKEISAAAKEQAGVDLSEDVIKLETHIKEVGEYTVPVSSGETFGEFTITVQAES